ncbi:MAG: YgiQ family radical SAM protein [Eubacteriales bacterium]
MKRVENGEYVRLGKEFLPISAHDMELRGWEDYDFLYVCGDAYVDHPSFGAAIISRVLEAEGFRVCMYCQPEFENGKMKMPFARPRLGVLVSSGNIDSMVAHYTAARRRRSEDWYSPGKKMGLRPDRAVIVYSREIRRIFGDIPIIIGGLEASLRRFAHYDYWDDAVRPSVLADSKADILSYGMGERSVPEIAKLLDMGVPPERITGVRGTCYISKTRGAGPFEAIECTPFEKCRDLSTEAGRLEYAKACRLQYREHDHSSDKAIVQRHGDIYIVQNPPALPLTTPEMDWVYSLPYCREWHPSYAAAGGVPGIDEVKFSITHVRGCFGNCSFCSIAFHQGRYIQTRSRESVLSEARLLTTLADFKGYIHDVGGPTANFRRPSCDGQEKRGLCRDRSCLSPKPCPNLKVDHSDYLRLLTELRAIPGVKKVFVRSGIRFDYLMADPDDSFFRALVRHHISGQLKVAPEHCSSEVLGYMNKPDFSVFESFKKKYEEENRRLGLKQYLVPYLMSSHPGSGIKNAVELAQYLRREKINPEQVQDFYPTPGTVSTCMFATGIDPRTLKPVFVPRTMGEKAWQRALLQSKEPRNRELVRAALISAGRRDLIGSGPECLIPDDGRSRREPEERAGKNRPAKKAEQSGRPSRYGKASGAKKQTKNKRTKR